MNEAELEAEFAAYADEASEWAALGIAILTEADVAMIEMAMTAKPDLLDYSPFYDEE